MRTGVDRYVSMGRFSVYLTVHDESGDHRRQWRTHSPSSPLFIDIDKAGIGGGLDMTNDPQDILLKLST
jgi:hypothetical protein